MEGRAFWGLSTADKAANKTKRRQSAQIHTSFSVAATVHVIG